jgi:sacsin
VVWLKLIWKFCYIGLGATKVCFLYDERDNLDCRDGLFDKGMIECQGQSLFVYNNAVFKDHDFTNLIKLGLNTKSSEKNKIGKFGLGFILLLYSSLNCIQTYCGMA